MKVGIAGSFSAVNRHVCVLEKIKDVAIAGCWSVNGHHNPAIDHDTGNPVIPEKIIENTDALIITDSGDFYFKLATMALRNARHVFLYTHLLKDLSDAFHLIKLGSEANVILKCGRTGKNGIDGVFDSIAEPDQICMIEFQHSIKLQERYYSLSDVLLEDMEIVSRMIHARATSVKAKGLGILSQRPEAINARLDFDNGVSVSYYCNVVDTRNEHNLKILMKESIFNYNLLTNDLSGWRRNRNPGSAENPVIIENHRVETGDYLFDDLSAFFTIIQSRPAFTSIYDNGFESFVLTDRILEKVSKTLVRIA